MAARMKGPANHRRVLHFAVTGALLGGLGCTSRESPKVDVKAEAKPPAPEFAPQQEIGPNPGPHELEPKPEPPLPPSPPPVGDIEDDYVNEGPIEEPEAVKLEPTPKG